MKEVHSLKYEVRSLKGQLLAHSWRNGSDGNEEDVICLSSILPVSNDEQILKLCKGLEDENSRKKLVILQLDLPQTNNIQSLAIQSLLVLNMKT